MSYFASMHPFVRNTTGSMEFGGTVMNKYMNKGNKSGNKRKTTDTAELALQSSRQSHARATASGILAQFQQSTKFQKQLI